MKPKTMLPYSLYMGNITFISIFTVRNSSGNADPAKQIAANLTRDAGFVL